MIKIFVSFHCMQLGFCFINLYGNPFKAW